MPQLSDFSVNHIIFTPNRECTIYSSVAVRRKVGSFQQYSINSSAFFLFPAGIFFASTFFGLSLSFFLLLFYIFFSLPAQLSRLIRKLTSLTKVTRLCELNGKGPDMLVFTRPKIPNLLMLPPYNY